MSQLKDHNTGQGYLNGFWSTLTQLSDDALMSAAAEAHDMVARADSARVSAVTLEALEAIRDATVAEVRRRAGVEEVAT